MANTKDNPLMNFPVFKLFNSTRDLEYLQNNLHELFHVVFVSMFNLKTKEHYVVPRIFAKEGNNNNFPVGIQQVTDGNMFWDEIVDMLTKDHDKDEFETKILLVMLPDGRMEFPPTKEEN